MWQTPFSIFGKGYRANKEIEHVRARVLDLLEKTSACYAGYFCIKYFSFLEKLCALFFFFFYQNCLPVLVWEFQAPSVHNTAVQYHFHPKHKEGKHPHNTITL